MDRVTSTSSDGHGGIGKPKSNTTTAAASAFSEKELEELKEKNYRLHLKIETLKQNHATEVEYLKEEIQVKVSEAKGQGEKLKSEFKLKEKNLVEQISSLTEENSQLRDELNVKKGAIDQLQRTVEHFKTVQVDRNGRTDQFDALRISHDQLTHELKSTRQILESVQSRIHELTLEANSNQELISELRDEIESKDQCISQLQTRIREADAERQEEIMFMQQNLMLNKQAEEEIADPTKRGNSLFSEVEERRVRVEEELTRLRTRVARLTTENVQLSSQIERGDCRSAIILTQLQLISKSQTDFIQELKKLKSESDLMYERFRDKFNSLKTEYKNKLVVYRDGVTLPDADEVEAIRNERDNLISENMAIRRELNDLKRELKHAILQKTECEANIKIYRVKLQAAQQQQSLNFGGSPSKNSEGQQGPGSGSGCGENWIYQNILADSAKSPKLVPEEIAADSNANANGALSMARSKKAEEIAECKQQ